MKRVLTAVGAAALLLPATAAAKGASQATIDGPGLSEPIVLKSDGGGDPSMSSKLGRLAENAGFFPAVFGQSPDPMLRTKPDVKLGPKYVVTYVMPGPNGTSSKIRQDLYPYAKPWLVTYTKPGQRFWDGQRTRGGWFQAAYDLKPTLVSAGLPATPPSSGGGGGDGWLRWVAIAITVAAGVGLLAALSVVALRRWPRPAEA
jgi:hypothetical protein